MNALRRFAFGCLLLLAAPPARADVSVSDDCTVDNSGAFTCLKSNGVPFGTLASGNLSGNNTFTGTQTFNGGVVISGGLSAGQGGTGATSPTAHGVAVSEGAAAYNFVPSAAGNLSQPLVGAGATADPVYGPINLAGTGTVANALPAANGGSGIASPTANSLLVGEGASAFNLIPAAAANLSQAVVGAGAGADPVYGPINLGGTGTVAGVLPPGNGGAVLVTPPQGRLSLVSGTAIQTSDQLSASTLFYVPFVGGSIPLSTTTLNAWSYMAIGSQLSVGLSTTGTLSGVPMDVYAWSNSGTPTLGIANSAWISTNARTASGGLSNVNGIWVNGGPITMIFGATGQLSATVAAGQGTYLGSGANFQNSSPGTFGMVLAPAAATSGSPGCVCLFNAYNRVPGEASEGATSAAWNYSAATWRFMQGSNKNQIVILDGLQVLQLKVIQSEVANDSLTTTICEVGPTYVNGNGGAGTPTFAGQYTASVALTGRTQVPTVGIFYPLLGLNSVAAEEFVAAGGNCGFQGSSSPVFDYLIVDLPI